MSAANSISVLMPVYDGTEPEHLALALHSLSQQTLRPTEVVIVEDGTLGLAHHEVIASSGITRMARLVRIALPVNRGLGVALQLGLEAASSEWIARVDSDDVLIAARFEKQLRHLEDLDLDLCGSAMWEFEGDPGNPTRLRLCPVTHDAIARRMRSNNPINHPTVIFRRDAALGAGGYRELYGMEDYDLFARMLASGARMANLSEPLVFFRSGDAMLSRRSGFRFLVPELQLQRRLYAYGLVSRTRAIGNFTIRVGFRLMPPAAKRVAYARVLSVKGARG